MRGYTCWDFHGEKRVGGSTSGSECNMDDDLPINNDRHHLNNMLDDLDDDVAQKEHAKFEKLYLAAEKALFSGCTKLTILYAVIKLFKIKASFGWSDISFTTLLEFLHNEMLPDDNELPISTYQAKQKKILLCPMDLVYIDLHECKEMPGGEFYSWHAEERKKDGKMRHVADSLQWRNIDNSFEEFGGDIRNIRLGLSSDGFNPFGNMSSPKQPGNDIDVYLKPLIDDLIKLWEPGDTHQSKGKKACPICEDCTHSVWLRHCRKTIYMGHRRSLLRNHLYRKKKELFDGTIERGVLRPPLDGEATFSRVRDINIVLGKGKDNPGPPKGIWKKKSIFWVLPYWEDLQVRHCLDVISSMFVNLINHSVNMSRPTFTYRISLFSLHITNKENY
ncbi:uncharacterized protein Tco_0393735 [Tanacetum coccineum]